jgi:hypothetical protein
MDNAEKSALKTAGIFGAITAVAVAPFATPIIWAAVAYGTYTVARNAYNNAKLKDAPKGKPEDDFFI